MKKIHFGMLVLTSFKIFEENIFFICNFLLYLLAMKRMTTFVYFVIDFPANNDLAVFC